MPVHPMDIDALLLPPPFAAGLRKLIARTLGLPKADGADAVMTALFGNDVPAFGQVRRISERDLKAACAAASLDAVPITGLRELGELLPNVRPETPACASCGEFPLSDTGGKIVTLPAGAACPFCKGTLALVPMRLKKLAWTDGRLVEPQTSHDLRVRAGERIPLDDEDIVAWAGGWLQLRLERVLKDAGLPVYGLLAYLHLRRRAFDELEDAKTLLQRPERFGLTDAKSIEEAVAGAQDFLAEREPTNVPRTRFPFIRGIDPAALPRLEVAGRTYAVEGKIGEGARHDVYRGAWDHPLTERAVIKAARGDDAAKALVREVANLAQLRQSNVNGTPFFVRQFPEVIASGSCLVDGAVRQAAAFRYKNRFDWTLADVIGEYPEGVEPQTMVWMWNRTLALVGWLQMAGWTHGALVPEHMLIHPVNHGMTFLDWSHAARTGKPIASPEVGHGPYHPAEIAASRTTPETDIAMSARVMIAVLGGDPANGSLPASVPGPIADILRLHGCYDDGATGRIADAFALEKEFGKVAKAVYGPRKYHPFPMPRRSR